MKDMNSNSIPTDADESSDSRHHISRKAEPPGASYVPTSPVRDYFSRHTQVESYRDDQMVTRGNVARREYLLFSTNYFRTVLSVRIQKNGYNWGSDAVGSPRITFLVGSSLRRRNNLL